MNRKQFASLKSRADDQPVMDDADATRTEMQAKARKLVKRWLIEAKRAQNKGFGGISHGLEESAAQLAKAFNL